MVEYKSLDCTMSTGVQYDLLVDSANQFDGCLELLHTVKTTIDLLHTVKTTIDPPFYCLRVRKLDEPLGIVYKLSRSSLVQYIHPEETQ